MHMHMNLLDYYECIAESLTRGVRVRIFRLGAIYINAKKKKKKKKKNRPRKRSGLGPVTS